jgi:periplasmic protein TonB
MSKIDVFDHQWIDLVFEGRNKEYGAYQLRRQDSKTTIVAFFSGITLLGVAVGIPYTVNLFAPKAEVIKKAPPLVVTPVDDVFVLPETQKTQPEPQPEAPQPETQKPAAPAAPAQPTIIFTPFAATSKPVVPEIPTMDEVLGAQPATTTTPGSENGSTMSTTPGITGGTGTTPSNTNGTGTEVVIKADEDPEFPGGLTKFRQQVADRYRTPDMQSESLIKLTVSFVVEKDGSITNIKVLRDPGHGAGTEAIRVLNSIKTKWKPGKIKGQPVRTAYQLPIVIKIH